jgi:hypothetical protein
MSVSDQADQSDSDDESGDQDESLGTKVTKDFKRKVRIKAAENDMTMSEYIRKVLERDIEGDQQND